MPKSLLEFFKSFILFAAKATFVFVLVIVAVLVSFNYLITSEQQILQPNIFNVEGTAKRKVTPDIVRLTLGTVIEGVDVVAIQKQANEKVSKSIAAIKGLGISEEKIQTSNYNLNPKYDDSGNKISSYSINIQLSVEIEDLDLNKNLPGDVIEASATTGLNEVRSLNFDVKNRDDILEELKTEAINDAKAKKDVLAAASGLRLGELKNVSFGGFYYPAYGRDTAVGVAESALAPDKAFDAAQILPGQTELSVTVTLQYEIR